MRVAVLSDIHGNLPALEAVLADVVAARVDLVVVNGDTMPGPMPGAVLAALDAFSLPVRCLHGNGELDVLASLRGEDLSYVPERVQPLIRWVAAGLTPAHAEWIATWPRTVGLDLPDLGEVLFCHATPRSAREIFTRLTPDERVMPAFEGVTASTVVCGHTHMQVEREVRGIRVVNAGSVGMPFGATGAYWLLLDHGVHHRRTEYDLQAAAARIRVSGYPQAEAFADSNVLEPPTEKEMLEVLERSANQG